MDTTLLHSIRSLIKGTGPETEITLRDLVQEPGALLTAAALILVALLA